MSTLTTHFLQTCSRFPDKTAIIDEGGEFTYQRLYGTACALSHYIDQLTRSENVGILLPTCKEFPAICYAIMMTGRAAVPINCVLAPPELEHIIHDAEIDTVFTSRHFEPLIRSRAKNVVYLEDLAAKAPSGPVAYKPKDVDPDDAAVLMYTSGTIAKPKGVILTHRNLTHNVEGCVEKVGVTHEDRLLGFLPLFHSYAFTTSMALPIHLGALVVYMRRFSAPTALEMIQKHNITAMFATASIFRVLIRTAKQSGQANIGSVRLCISGGEPVATDVAHSFEETFGVPLLEGYGLTEHSPVISVNLPEDNKIGTAGTPLPGIEMRVVDDNGVDLPPGSEGELWVRSDSVMKGYRNMPELTAEVLTEEGWLKTGDMAVLDEEGRVKITGRKKELIICSGENISPVEVEEILAQHPKVFEVGVVGLPDPSRGEIPKAYIVLKEGETATAEEMRDFCRGKLAPYKIPRKIEFRSELPHTITGKVLRRALREEELRKRQETEKTS